MSTISKNPRISEVDYNQGNSFVTEEEYGLLKSSAKQALSPLDMSMPRLYGTRWILCFPLGAEANKTEIYEILRLGLARTIASIPWISGNIVPAEGRDPKDNRIQISDSLNGVKFPYKDLSKILPSYADLKNQHFPLSKLRTEELSPLGVMPEPSNPVMAAQANFIDGGLLLTIGVHHSACDALGLDSIIEIWAHNTTAALNPKVFHFCEYDPTINDRSAIMVGDTGANLADFPEFIIQPTPPASTIDVNTHQLAATPYALPPMSAKIFYFSPSSLATLKVAAAAYTTNDALSAFLWRHITIARNPGVQASGEALPGNSGDGEFTSALLFPANIRTRTSPPLHHSYLGNASMAVITNRLNISTLASPAGLKTAAIEVRKSLRKLLDTPNRVQLTIGFLDSRPDPTELKYAYNGFLGPDLSATSWADLRIYESIWGGLGKVEAFRVPGEAADGSIVVFPKLEEGGLELMISLETEAMKRLIEDSEFRGMADLWA